MNIKLNKIPNILLDVYLNSIYQGTVNESECLDLQKQILENQISGYSLKINSAFYYLFDENLSIENCEIFIDLSGECIDWFPCYKLNNYGLVEVFDENLQILLQIRKIQKLLKK